MSEKLRESLSALMDNEANELELHRVLAQLDQQPELKQDWARLNVASSVLKGDASAQYAFDISGKVSEALANEVAHGGGAKQFVNKHWSVIKPLSRLSVAASVTAAVFFSAQGMNTNSASGLPVATASDNYVNSSSVVPTHVVAAQSPVTSFSMNPFATSSVSQNIIPAQFGKTDIGNPTGFTVNNQQRLSQQSPLMIRSAFNNQALAKQHFDEQFKQHLQQVDQGQANSMLPYSYVIKYED